MQVQRRQHATVAITARGRSVPGTRPLILSFMLVGLLVRGLLAPFGGHGFDIGTMQAWSQAMLVHPLSSFYGLDLPVPKDHLPGDLWILYGAARLLDTIPPAMAIKLIAGLADLGIGILLYRIGCRVASRRDALVAAAAFVLGPSVLFVSTIWGQWDAVSTGFMLAAMYLLVRGGAGTILAWPALAYACLIKPQLGIVAPFLIIYQWKRGGLREVRNGIVGIGLGLVVVQLAAFPFRLGLPGVPMRWSLLDVIEQSVGQYQAITLGAHNLWGLLIAKAPPPHDLDIAAWGLSYRTTGIALFVVAYLVAIVAAFRVEDRNVGLFWGTCVALMAMYLTLTRMHERYLFPAIPLSLVVALLLPHLRLPVALLQVTFLLNVYTAYTFQKPEMWLPGLQTDAFFRVNALLNLVILVATLLGVTVGRRKPVTTTAPHAPDLVARPKPAQSMVMSG